MGTSSGAKVVVYNTRERLISTDPNRAQSFGAQAMAEMLRWMLDASNEQDVTGGGFEQLGTGTEPSLRATVLSGIRGRPEIGTTNLFVEPGAGLFIDNPGPGPDDSISSFLADPGVQTTGVLALTPGAGATRIDVLECQRIANVLETDNRDIFNPATGLFSPAAVMKVQNSVLTYRLRTGTPGSGFPGVAAGWLPLMVASVPAAAGSWDFVTCWDVRPLAADRISGPFATSRLINENRRSLSFCNATSSPGIPLMNAEVDTTFGGYRAGGLIRDNWSSIYFDPTNANNQAAGFAFGTTGALWSVFLVFPFGLPRWVRYSDSSSGLRIPGAQRGIPVVSTTIAGNSGAPLAPGVQSPAATGLQDPAAFNAVLAFCGRGPQTPATVPIGMHCDGRLWTFVNPDVNALAPATNDGTHIVWSLPGGGSNPIVPGTARAVFVRLHAEFQFPMPALGAQGIGDIDGAVTVSDFNANTLSQAPVQSGEHQTCVDGNWVAPPTPGVLFVRDFTIRVPLSPNLSFSNTPPFAALQTVARNFFLTWTHNLGIAGTNVGMTMLGWELGP